jgi:hypothetical protein
VSTTAAAQIENRETSAVAERDTHKFTLKSATGKIYGAIILSCKVIVLSLGCSSHWGSVWYSTFLVMPQKIGLVSEE